MTFLTGASAGIGRSLALRLAADGEPIVVAARNLPALEELAAEIRKRGGESLAVQCDVTDPHSVAQAIGRAEAGFGPVTRLVANAGGSETTRVDAFDADHVARVLDLNVLGVARCIEAVLPGMLKRGTGHLVVTSSLAAYRGLPGAAAYSAAKAALTRLLEGLRVDLRGRGVDVTVIAPGFVRNKPTRSNQPFMVELEPATERMARAIRARKPYYAFPWSLAALMRAASMLPPALYDRLLAGRS